MSASSIELVNAWPICNDPVTLGGGITMVNFSLERSEVSGLKNPFNGVNISLIDLNY